MSAFSRTRIQRDNYIYTPIHVRRPFFFSFLFTDLSSNFGNHTFFAIYTFLQPFLNSIVIFLIIHTKSICNDKLKDNNKSTRSNNACTTLCLSLKDTWLSLLVFFRLK